MNRRNWFRTGVLGAVAAVATRQAPEPVVAAPAAGVVIENGSTAMFHSCTIATQGTAPAIVVQPGGSLTMTSCTLMTENAELTP